MRRDQSVTQAVLALAAWADARLGLPRLRQWVKSGRLPAIDVGSGERAFYRIKLRDLTTAAKQPKRQLKPIEPVPYDWRRIRRGQV